MSQTAMMTSNLKSVNSSQENNDIAKLNKEQIEQTNWNLRQVSKLSQMSFHSKNETPSPEPRTKMNT